MTNSPGLTCALVTDSWGPLSKANFTLTIVQVRNRRGEIESFTQALQARKQQCLDANLVWAWFALASLCICLSFDPNKTQHVRVAYYTALSAVGH